VDGDVFGVRIAGSPPKTAPADPPAAADPLGTAPTPAEDADFRMVLARRPAPG